MNLPKPILTILHGLLQPARRTACVALLLSVLLGGALTACTTDDPVEEIQLSSSCYISRAVLGTFDRTLSTKTQDGRDSTYRVGVNGAYYPLDIDHLRGRITLRHDSLPTHTDTRKTTFASMDSQGTVKLRSLVSGQDTLFNTADSLDFSVSRVLTVYAQDGSGRRAYVVSLPVHREEGDSTTWTTVLSGQPTLQSLSRVKAVVAGGRFYAFGQRAGGTYYLTTPTGHISWSTGQTSLPVDPQSVTSLAGRLYALTTAGELCTATDAAEWTALATPEPLRALAVAGSEKLVALTRDGFTATRDGEHWQAEPCDEPALLPQSCVQGTLVQAAGQEGMETLLVIGRTAEGERVVWKQNCDLSGRLAPAWYELPLVSQESYALPELSTYSLTTYDGSPLLCGTTAEGQVAPLRLSRDNGRTWEAGAMRPVPAGRATQLSIASDTEGRVWTVLPESGEVMLGRINRVMWKH